MIKKYLIDLNVLSVLLNSKDGTILNENYNKLMIGVQKVIESTINEFLTQKGLESFKFNAISNLPDDQINLRVKEVLKDTDLIKLIDKNVQLFYKVFIDAYWGKISLAAQQDIEQYLNEYDDIQKELNKLIVENIDAINELTELLREKLIKENSSNIKVNLGGGMSASQNFTPTNPIIS